MPAQAGIQGGEGVAITESLDSRFRGNDGRGVNFESTSLSPFDRERKLVQLRFFKERQHAD